MSRQTQISCCCTTHTHHTFFFGCTSDIDCLRRHWVKEQSWINLRWLTIFGVGWFWFTHEVNRGKRCISRASNVYAIIYAISNCIPFFLGFQNRKMMKSNCSHFVQCSTRINYHIKFTEWFFFSARLSGSDQKARGKANIRRHSNRDEKLMNFIDIKICFHFSYSISLSLPLSPSLYLSLFVCLSDILIRRNESVSYLAVCCPCYSIFRPVFPPLGYMVKSISLIWKLLRIIKSLIQGRETESRMCV